MCFMKNFWGTQYKLLVIFRVWKEFMGEGGLCLKNWGEFKYSADDLSP